MPDIHDAQVAIAHHGPDVGFEVDRRAVGECPTALCRDAQALPYRTTGSIGCHEILTSHRPFGVAVARAYEAGDAGLVLLEAHQLNSIVMLSSQTLRMPPQHGFEPHLRHEQPRGRTEALNAGAPRAREVLQFLTRHAFDGHDGAVLFELPLRCRLDGILDAG